MKSTTRKIKRPAPLPPRKWAEDLAPVLHDLGEPLNIHKLMARHAALLTAWMPFRNHVVTSSTLAPRQRELLILRTAVNCNAQYEWAHHVMRGRKAGLSDDEIQRVKNDPESATWPEAEKALLKAADECWCDAIVSDPTYAALAAHFDDRQLLDILATVGMYITLATMINTFRLPLESDHCPD